MRTLVTLLLLAFLAAPASASAMRVDLNKKNQATAPVKFTVTTSKLHGLVSVRVELARTQAPLDHLWRIDVVLRKGKRSVLTAPLATTLDGDTLGAELILDPATMKTAEIWIRTGEHAPLAETIYAIDLGSFR